jgi:uncharacterized protein YrzB (UPF0473 family)
MLEQDNEVILLDEDGQECRFEHILTFLYEKERYIAFSPVEEADADEAEVILLKVESDGDEDRYVPIQSEVMEQEIFARFLELMEEREEG